MSILILLPAKQTPQKRTKGGEKVPCQTFSFKHQHGKRKENTFINLLALSQGTMLIFHLHSMPPGNTPVQS